ncbi:MAG: D-glycerate dehydrogenase [Proteobacteria bacterium]|nr:D-glycerate dehydrogenase [Pseudomonadota bacterium]
MDKARVIVTRRWPQAVEQILQRRFDVKLNERDVAMSFAELQQALREADALCPTVTDAITAELLDTAPRRTRLIANYGVGFNHIDIAAARAQGLTVTNTPDALTDCTADLAMTLLLMAARRAGEGERELRAGAWQGWRPTHMLGAKVTGKTLGLVGFGRIARAMAHKAHFGFGMRIVFHTRTPPPAEICKALGATSFAQLDDMLAASDFVSLHCPGGAATRHLINGARLAAMRKHAFLINTARGDVVDHDALVEALRERHIAGAGLDVYVGEPRVPPALLGLDNVVLLPHLGSATEETRIAMGMRVIDNLDDFFEGRVPRDRVV